MERQEPATTATQFEDLLAEVVDRAYAVAYRLTRSRDDAEDIVQEAALQAYRAFHQFQPGTNFKAWFLRIVTNCFFALCRKRKRQPVTVNVEDAEPLYMYMKAYELGLQNTSPDPAALVIGKLGSEHVGQAIAQLPEEFRVVCALYFVEDASYQDIAEILECPVGTVRSRLHRGRRMLQKALWHLAEEHGIVASLSPKDTE